MLLPSAVVGTPLPVAPAVVGMFDEDEIATAVADMPVEDNWLETSPIIGLLSAGDEADIADVGAAETATARTRTEDTMNFILMRFGRSRSE